MNSSVIVSSIFSYCRLVLTQVSFSILIVFPVGQSLNNFSQLSLLYLPSLTLQVFITLNFITSFAWCQEHQCLQNYFVQNGPCGIRAGWNQSQLSEHMAPTQPPCPTLVFHSSSQLLAQVFKLFIRLCYFITEVIREYSGLEGPPQLSCCSKSKAALHSLGGILKCWQVAFLSPSLWVAIVLRFIAEAAKARLWMGIWKEF